MRGFTEFVRTTVIGGVVGVLPVLLVVLVMAQSLDMLVGTLEPIAEQLPMQKLVGIEVAMLLAILLVLTACFAAGLLLRTRIGSATVGWVERVFLNRLPGYSFAKSVTQGLSGLERQPRFETVLVDVSTEGARMIGMAVEKLDDERVVVFVPFAPTPTVGQVFVVPESRIERIDASANATLGCIMQWGVGARRLLGVSAG